MQDISHLAPKPSDRFNAGASQSAGNTTNGADMPFAAPGSTSVNPEPTVTDRPGLDIPAAPTDYAHLVHGPSEAASATTDNASAWRPTPANRG